MTLEQMGVRSDVASRHFDKKDLSTLCQLVSLQYHAGAGEANDRVRSSIQMLISYYALVHGMTVDWMFSDKPMFQVVEVRNEWFRIDATVGSVISE